MWIDQAIGVGHLEHHRVAGRIFRNGIGHRRFLDQSCSYMYLILIGSSIIHFKYVYLIGSLKTKDIRDCKGEVIIS